MTTINGGEAVYSVLKANGIDTMFGLLGGSMLELFDAMYRGGEIAYVGTLDERAAGQMADAWARRTAEAICEVATKPACGPWRKSF